MGALSEAIKAHGKSIARRELTITEWGVTVYVHPLTVEDRNQQIKTAQKDPYLSFIDVIVAACRNDQGARVFDIEDKLTLKKHADPRVVERVAAYVLEPYTQLDTTGETGAGSEMAQS